MKSIRQLLCWHNWRWEGTDDLDRNMHYIRAQRCRKCAQWREGSLVSDLIVVAIWATVFALIAKMVWMVLK